MVNFNGIERQIRFEKSDLEKVFEGVLNSGQFINGDNVRLFEVDFAKFLGVEEVISTGSGTSSLEIVSRFLAKLGHKKIATAANAGGYASLAAFAANMDVILIDCDIESGLVTKEELDDLAKLGVSISKNADEVKRLLKYNITKNMIKTIGSKSTKYLMNLLLFLKRIGVIKLGDIVFKVGAVTYTFDKLYLYVFRDSIFANKEILDKRTTNDLRYLINKLLGYDKEVQEYILLKTNEALQKVIDNPNTQEKMVDIKIDESTDTNAVNEYINKIKLEKEKDINRIKLEKEKYEKSLIAPSIDEVLSGKKVIKLNQKGNSVKEIQKMLYDLEYDHLITNFETQVNWNDGIYGNNTKNAVETFQEDNEINIDGIVGKNTLLKIKELYNNKNNVK